MIVCITIEHRRTITPIRGIDYSNHNPGKIHIIPPDHIISEWEKDYEIMQQNMIYGKSLPFSDLLNRIEEVQLRINKKKPKFI